MTSSDFSLLVLSTGGTIDKVYFDRLSEFQVGDSCVDSIFAEAKVSFSYRIQPLFAKDSLDIDDNDRSLLLQAIRQSTQKYVLVTHGTDSMCRSAEYVQQAGVDKVVLFTGALAPASSRHSDAMFNLGMACAALQCLPAGVYLAVNGRIFPANAVRKDRSLGMFVSK